MKCLTYTKYITNLSSLLTKVTVFDSTISFYNSQNGLRFGIGILSLILKVRLKVTFESVFTFRLNFQFCDCSCSSSSMHIERWTTTIAAKPIFDFGCDVMWCQRSYSKMHLKWILGHNSTFSLENGSSCASARNRA